MLSKYFAFVYKYKGDYKTWTPHLDLHLGPYLEVKKKKIKKVKIKKKTL